MPFEIIKGDITKQRVDAIVNAANRGLHMGGGVCGAIFAAAGAKELEEECGRIGGIETGEAVITGGYALPAKYVIHTAGPIWRGGGQGEKALLEACYRNSLELAAAKGLKSVAFPVISAGIYGYPKDQAIDVAVKSAAGFLRHDDSDMDIYLVVFDRDGFEIDTALTADIDRYIAERLEPFEAPAAAMRFAARLDVGELQGEIADDELLGEMADYGLSSGVAGDELFGERVDRGLPSEIAEVGDGGERRIDMAGDGDGLPSGMADVGDDGELLIEMDGDASLLKELRKTRPFSDVFEPEPSFSALLRKQLIAKKLNDVDVYKRANLSRQHWSKIISNPDYQPGKKTVIALALAMRLNLDETKDLLLAAGFALSPSYTFDIIIEYFIDRRQYDVFEINEVLFKYEQPLLV